MLEDIPVHDGFLDYRTPDNDRTSERIYKVQSTRIIENGNRIQWGNMLKITGLSSRPDRPGVERLRIPPGSEWPLLGVNVDGSLQLAAGFRERLARFNRISVGEIHDRALGWLLAAWYLTRRTDGKPVDLHGEVLLQSFGIDALITSARDVRH